MISSIWHIHDERWGADLCDTHICMWHIHDHLCDTPIDIRMHIPTDGIIYMRSIWHIHDALCDTHICVHIYTYAHTYAYRHMPIDIRMTIPIDTYTTIVVVSRESERNIGTYTSHTSHGNQNAYRASMWYIISMRKRHHLYEDKISSIWRKDIIYMRKRYHLYGTHIMIYMTRTYKHLYDDSHRLTGIRTHIYIWSEHISCIYIIWRGYDQ